MISDADLGKILDMLRPYLARQVADTVAGTARLGRIPTLQPATVIDTNTATGVIDVLPDGGGTTTVPAATLVGIPEFGSRVMLLYEPPAGVFVVGYIGARRSPHLAGGYWRRSVTQSITPATLTAMSFDNAVFDSDGYIGSIPGTTFTIPTQQSGRYLFTAAAAFTPVPPGRASIELNAPTYSVSQRASIDGAHGEDRAGVTAFFNLAEGDTVTFNVYHETFGFLSVTGYMEAIRLPD